MLCRCCWPLFATMAPHRLAIVPPEPSLRVPARAGAANPDVNNTSGSRAVIAVDKVGGKVRFYDAATLAETRVIETAKFPHEVAVSPDHRRACVSIYGTGQFGRNPEPGTTIEVFDLETQERERILDIQPFFAPHGLMFDPSGKLWAACDAAGKLLCIDVDAGRIEEAYDTGSTGSHFIVMTPDASRIYVSNKGDDLGVFDLRKRRLIRSIALPRGSEGVTASPDGRYVVTADNDVADLHLIDLARNDVVARVPLRDMPPSHSKRSRLIRPRFSPDGAHLLVTNYASATVHHMPSDELRDQALIVVAKGPMGSAFAPGGRTALVAGHDSGVVTVIDLERRGIAGCHEAGDGIETLSYY